MSTPLNPTVAAVTAALVARSRESRAAYEAHMERARRERPHREDVSCGNFAHAFAASSDDDKTSMKGTTWPNLGIVTAYNDMLSAHQPFETYPQEIKAAARAVGASAQVAGGVPAMCDGVTQGQPGMELSLFSRDVIAMATAVSLSHGVFDAGLMLGVCDKIVPGLFIGAARFGHLPIMFVPAGPMTSGLPNPEKARVRQLFAEGKVGRDALLEAEMQSYHGPGTCTFYGTANSNQMLMEVMGLHLPGIAFVNPGTGLRAALTRAAAQRAAKITRLGDEYLPFAEVVDAKAIVNAVVGLHATGGSTNHAIHLVAMAAAVGYTLTWDDMDALAGVTPLLTRIYPNGSADVNHFHAAGGMGFIVRELLSGGLLHPDVTTVAGRGLEAYTEEPYLAADGRLAWRPAPEVSGDLTVLRPLSDPFAPDGGLKLIDGDLGRAVVKISAVKPEHRIVEAPAMVFDSQEAFLDAFKAGRLDRDVIAVVRFQGPKANGMPELHKLSPSLSSLLDRGFKVALVTDGRMSGASGKVAAAIHVTPEALDGGPIARVRDGDVIALDCNTGEMTLKVDPAVFAARPLATADLTAGFSGWGRELFAGFRDIVTSAETGASALPRLLDVPLPTGARERAEAE